MATLQVPDKQKIGVEQLLLGDKKVQHVDCKGNVYDIHGLMANDLEVKLLDNTIIGFVEYMNKILEESNTGGASIGTGDGDSVTMQQLAGSVEFEASDIEAKYNTLYIFTK